MPKHPHDKRRYYEEGGDSGGRAMGRSRAPRERDSSGYSGGNSGDRSGYRRPGPSHHGSQPYSRPSSGSGGGPTGGRSQRSRDEPSEPYVPYQPGGDAPPPAVGRGGMRGRRTLPVDIITRPREIECKTGKTGQAIDLQTNYFKLLSAPDWGLYQYRIDFSPEEERNIVKKGLLRVHKDKIGAYVFDGTILYTSNRLQQPLEFESFKKEDNSPVLITVRLVGDITKGDYHYMQFFNILMRKCLDSLKLQLVGRNYFDAKNRVSIPEFRLELWPGYMTSIRQHEHDVLMCAEITHKVMRQETIFEILTECYRSFGKDYQRAFKSQVIGIVVLTDYNNKTYRIDDVNFDETANGSFKKKDGTDWKYIDYYKQKHNLYIEHREQPLLVSRTKARDRKAGQPEYVYLIPELCRSTGLTDNMRNNFKLMQGLAKYTRVTPVERIKKLNTFNKRLQSEKDVLKEVEEWSLKLDTQLVRLTGRVLPADKIIFKDSTSDVNMSANWTGDVRNRPFVHVGPLEEWFVLCQHRMRREVQNFVGMIMKNAMGMGFKINNPRYHDLGGDSPQEYAQALEEIKSRSNPQLIFCVAMNNRGDRYAAIKRKCCLDRPVPTQVVVAKNLSNKQAMSIATKIAIQMNCKIGGIPWTVSIPASGLMVVGFDVCHDTATKGKDFGAMVASMDPRFGRYFSAVSAHTNNEELSKDFAVNLCKAINQFKTYNTHKPKKIVIYRDGVGDGMIPHVHGVEVKNILAALENMYENPEDVKLTFIVVTKKINTRFFYNGQNPPPGTIVDDVVTDPTKYDFFVVSQHVREGTVTPTAYNVIHDKSGLAVDHLQRLTYKLCHMYFNWSGTVRVPAPCQYAHKLAFLVSQSIHQAPDNLLETLLYFL